MCKNYAAKKNRVFSVLLHLRVKWLFFKFYIDLLENWTFIFVHFLKLRSTFFPKNYYYLVFMKTCKYTLLLYIYFIYSKGTV